MSELLVLLASFLCAIASFSSVGDGARAGLSYMKSRVESSEGKRTPRGGIGTFVDLLVHTDEVVSGSDLAW